MPTKTATMTRRPAGAPPRALLSRGPRLLHRRRCRRRGRRPPCDRRRRPVRNIADQTRARRSRTELPTRASKATSTSRSAASRCSPNWPPGTMDDVRPDRPELSVGRPDRPSRSHASGVPVDTTKAVHRAERDIRPDARVKKLIAVAGVEGGLTIGDGAVHTRRRSSCSVARRSRSTSRSLRPGRPRRQGRARSRWPRQRSALAGKSVSAVDVKQHRPRLGDALFRSSSASPSACPSSGVEVTAHPGDRGRVRVVRRDASLRLDDADSSPTKGTCRVTDRFATARRSTR